MADDCDAAAVRGLGGDDGDAGVVGEQGDGLDPGGGRRSRVDGVVLVDGSHGAHSTGATAVRSAAPALTQSATISTFSKRSLAYRSRFRKRERAPDQIKSRDRVEFFLMKCGRHLFPRRKPFVAPSNEEQNDPPTWLPRQDQQLGV